MPETEAFGSWVRHQRRGLDLTQDELARRIGCARITIRKIEAQQLRPSRQMARLLGQHLGISAHELENFMRFARGLAPVGQVAADPTRHNLPPLATSFVGREADVAEVCQLLRKSHLITLTGAGGTGKTRLALQVAAEVLDRFGNGLWFIELAPLSDPALIPNTIASVLGVREEPSRPLLSTLLDWLHSRQLLLILDNCEHLLDACAAVANAVLQASPETRILTTSREALGIASEISYRVPSLASPDPAQVSQFDAEQFQDYPALRLFIERAAQVATVNLTKPNLAAIAEICFRLDGIPLAIELAAARARVLRVDQIADRLSDSFRLLTNGSRTALPRHQTLHSLIDWSHNLLSQSERVLFRRLAIFAGGWTLDAAEEICSGDGIESPQVLDLLTHLADKSLITVEERAAEPRFRMLETIRTYARAKMVEAGEYDSLRDRHLAFFVRLAEDTQPRINSAQRTEWLPRLELEHGNLRAALEWSCGRDLETARWLAGMLERFWFFGDHLGEARAWYARVLAGSDGAPPSKGLALARLGSGCVAFNLELMDEAQGLLEASVDLWRQVGDAGQTAWAREWLAYLLLQRGEAARADSIYTEHEALFRSDGLSLVWVLSSWGAAKSAMQLDDPGGQALLDEALAVALPLQDPFAFMMCYSCLGDRAVLQGNLEAAARCFVEALEWRKRLGTRWIIAAGFWQVASIMRLRGDDQQAEPMYQQALTLARNLGDQRSEAHIAQELGVVALHLGRAEQARTLLKGSLASFQKWGDVLGMARCLLGFADLWLAQYSAERAVRLLTFLDTWLQASKIQFLHFDRANYERSLAGARSQISPAGFEASRERGRQMTLEQAVALALGSGDTWPARG